MANVSDVKVYPNKSNHPVIKGNGSCVLGSVVKVKFTVMNGSKGVFASLPSQRSKAPGEDGKYKYYPDVSILSKEVYAEFQNAVKQAYASVMGQAGAGEANQDPAADGIDW